MSNLIVREVKDDEAMRLHIGAILVALPKESGVRKPCNWADAAPHVIYGEW